MSLCASYEHGAHAHGNDTSHFFLFKLYGDSMCDIFQQTVFITKAETEQKIQMV